jgi:dTDP-4-amino-4,6-dideoxygalactose transaminase
VTEQVAREILTLPISASMTMEDAAYVTAELKTALMAGVA